jgi:hypothetical protein
VAGAKRDVAPSGSTLAAKCPYRGVWKPRFVQPSLPLFFSVGLYSLNTLFARSSPSDAATVMGTTASAADAAIGVTPGPAPDGQPRTPEGVLEDVVEDSEGEPEVVWEEAPVEGAMITVRTTVAPSPSRGA